LVLVAIPSFLIGMIIIHAYVLFMMAMTLITDFSTVLLDTADNQIILPKPVSGRTLFMARMVHILVYLLEFTIAMALVPLAVIFFKYGILTGLGSILTILLTVLMAVFTTYLLYMVLLRFSNEQKLREIITYFQIFMGLFFMAGYQVIPRMMSMSSIFSSFTLHYYSYFLPPVWMAYSLDVLYSLTLDSTHLLMIGLALGMPLVSFWLLIKWLAPVFGRKIAALDNDSAVRHRLPATGKSFITLSSFFSNLVCKTRLEKGAFEMVWKITGRDRGFRLQLYPSMAYILVFMFIFVLKSGKGIAESMRDLHQTNYWLWLIYLPVFVVQTSYTLVTFNENYQASWIYQSLPVSLPGELITGTLKALLVKYFFFTYLILFCVALYIWGDIVLIHFAFGLLNNLLCFFIITSLSDHYLAFSRQPRTQQQTGRFILIFLQMIVMALLVGLHYLIMNLHMVIYVAMPILAFASWLLIRRIRKKGWEKISI
jgi:hypothetical protein